jgi:glucosamine-6-phosphate deaminase
VGILQAAHVQVDTALLQSVKALIRETEAVSAATSCGVPEQNTHFLNMPFYETGAH